MNPEILKRARDLAEFSGKSLDEAVAALHSALEGNPPPLKAVRRLPWYLRPRFIPIIWRQKWIYRKLSR